MITLSGFFCRNKKGHVYQSNHTNTNIYTFSLYLKEVPTVYRASSWFWIVPHHVNTELGGCREPSRTFFALVRFNGRMGFLVGREGRRVCELFVALPAHKLFLIWILKMQCSETELKFLFMKLCISNSEWRNNLKVIFFETFGLQGITWYDVASYYRCWMF